MVQKKRSKLEPRSYDLRCIDLGDLRKREDDLPSVASRVVRLARVAL